MVVNTRLFPLHQTEAMPGDEEPIECEGEGFKLGRHIHQWKRRWYLLRNNYVYYYMHRGDDEPRGVIFMEVGVNIGCE